MAVPTSRNEFKNFVMRKIGAPVIQINVADEQVDDRIDEAISFWNDYHYNGFEHIYIKHLVTEGEITQGYIEIPDEVLGVTRIFNIGSSISMGGGMWNVQYQYVLNNMSELTNGSISNFWMYMQNIEFVQEWMVGVPIIRYNRHVNRLHIDDKDLTEGMWIVIEAYSTVSQDDFYRMWSDRWLQNYAAVLIQEQWGLNLGKFTGMQLMGGVQFNAAEILANARADRQRMEEEAISGLQPLVYNFIG
jgi:hypothetical protein